MIELIVHAAGNTFERDMRAEHLAYFKDLLEGRASERWAVWFRRHEASLAAEMPRLAFLHLKFHGLDEVERILAEASVAYEPNPAAIRRERYLANFSPAALDERGQLRPSVRRRAYRGAMGMLLDGRWDEARRALNRQLTSKRTSWTERHELLQDMCFDGEHELRYGDQAAGRVMLEVVASFEPADIEDDLIEPARNIARQLLAGREPE